MPGLLAFNNLNLGLTFGHERLSHTTLALFTDLCEDKTPDIFFVFQIPCSFNELINLARIGKASIGSKSPGFSFDFIPIVFL